MFSGNVFGGGRTFGGQFNTGNQQQQDALNLAAKSQNNLDAIVYVVIFTTSQHLL
jgi:hypothetical protein